MSHVYFNIFFPALLLLLLLLSILCLFHFLFSFSVRCFVWSRMSMFDNAEWIEKKPLEHTHMHVIQQTTTTNTITIIATMVRIIGKCKNYAPFVISSLLSLALVRFPFGYSVLHSFCHFEQSKIVFISKHVSVCVCASWQKYNRKNKSNKLYHNYVEIMDPLSCSAFRYMRQSSTNLLLLYWFHSVRFHLRRM